MPAVGIWGGERVEAWSLTDEEWLLVRATYRDRGLTMTCGQPGEPVKRQGTRYFRHQKGDNCGLHEGGRESVEHLRTKSLVAEVARSLGWTATIEAPALDRSWIADVLLEKGDLKLAIEVQWAAQTEQDFRRRTERYERDGVVCRWLVGPKNHGRDLVAVNAREIGGTGDALTVSVPSGLGGSEHIPMAEGLRILLNGSLQPRYEALVDGVEVDAGTGSCHNSRCLAAFSFWFIRAVSVWTRCGLRGTVRFTEHYLIWRSDRPESLFEDQIVAAINRSDLPNATRYQPTDSKMTNQRYSAQRCPGCNWHLGDGFIEVDPPQWVSYRVPIEPIMVPLSPSATATPHQCIDQGKGRCVQNNPTGTNPLDGFGLGTRPDLISAGPLPPRRREAM